MACALTAIAAGAAEPGAPRGVAHPALWPSTHSTGLVDPVIEAQVSALLAGMSIEEKVGQMIQADLSTIRPDDLRQYPLGSILAGGNTPPLDAPDRSPMQAWVDTARAFRTVSLEKRAGHAPIPVMFGVDAVHGNSNVVGATIFPHNVGLGAAHDPELMRRIGAATAEETAAAGIDWAFGPTLAVPQDSRWGRSYEGYSEDPALVRSYAGAMVRGLQGESGIGHMLQQGHVAASIKHFLGDGGTTEGVDQGDTDVSEQELIRTHAPGYLAAIPAGALTVMASFSSWQGSKMHGNRSLLTDVLKGQLGFEGFVVGDWNGHGQVPGCTPGDCPGAANAGLDMYMAPDQWRELYKATLAEVSSGVIARSRVDDAVRRILRVKFRLGLFEPQRPLEGHGEVLGSPAHRQLAREAVRASLVLLKNNGGVLPLRASAHILVAGSAADDIGRQCGGWTLSWQGTENTNSDFPNGQSIYSGLRAALEAAGGSAEWSAEGKYTHKPDAAVVVFGELPYAEMQGDLHSLEFQAGDKQDLALLRRLKAAGIPVVAVFLSGRALWVNPEINAADAFVAAWFPGSEGGGVADVLVGDAAGKPRFDFSGRLSYSWPKSAGQFHLNHSVTPYEPQFPLGYGLGYQQPQAVPVLSEAPGLDGAVWNVDRYIVEGKVQAPWSVLVDNGAIVSSQSVAPGQALSWNGRGSAGAMVRGAAVDLRRQANADLSLLVEYRLDHAADGPVQLMLGCVPACPGNAALEVAHLLRAATAVDGWQTLKIRLSCFREAGTVLSAIDAPFALRTAGHLGLTLRTVRLVSDPAGAICPSPNPPAAQ
jgi:beta-glucosidase